MEALFAECLGIISGDGCLSYSFPKSQTGPKYYIYICGHSKDDLDFLIHTKELIKILFNKETSINFRSDKNCAYIKFSDKRIFNELSNYLPIGDKYNSIRIPEEVLNSNKLFRSFIKGYFDTDGTVIHVKGYPRLEIKSKSQLLLEQSLSKLRALGFYGSLSKCKECYRLEIPGEKNLRRWLKLIGFSNKKHLKKVVL